MPSLSASVTRVLALEAIRQQRRCIADDRRSALTRHQLQMIMATTHTHTHTRARARAFNGPLSGTTEVSRYQKGKTNLDFTEARDSEWQ